MLKISQLFKRAVAGRRPDAAPANRVRDDVELCAAELEQVAAAGAGASGQVDGGSDYLAGRA
jgi:hypothetical protein